ncbi:hypothetical protein NE237_026027 [Protea cynaroides]|uniref:Uncharacterized protein n=1 Tax=Protea cynaroides TaxID=273540 RepID=A0A9Q0H5C9_9MAGN|nr:hypothetical protein NE237_026027 [Protea cynaroides]
MLPGFTNELLHRASSIGSRVSNLNVLGVSLWFLRFPMSNLYLDPSLLMLFQCSPTPSCGVFIWSHWLCGGVVRDIPNPDFLRLVALSYSASEGNVAAPLLSLVTEGGITRVIIPQDAYENPLKLFQYSLIGRFDLRGVLMEDIEKQVTTQWSNLNFEIVSLGKGFYNFRLFSNKDILTV